MNEPGKNRVFFGNFEADLQTEELWKFGRKLKLGGQPFGILAMLLERPGELVTREALRARLWSADTFVDFDQGLNAAVNKLRDCLSDSADEPKYIETLPRRGYRFIADLKLPVRAAPVVVGEVENDSAVPGIAAMAETVALGRAAASAAPVLGAMHQPSDGTLRSESRVPMVIGWVLAATLVFSLGSVAYRKLATDRPHVPTSLGGPALLGGSPRPASDPAFSPDGNRMAYRQIESASGSPQLNILYLPAGARSDAAGSDRSLQADGGSANAPGLFVSSLGGEKVIQLTQSESDCCPVWSPDGERVAFSRMEGDVQSIYVISSQGGTPSKLYSARRSHFHGELDWSPDGQFLLFSADAPNGGAQIFALVMKDKQVVPLTVPGKDDIDWGAAYSPDGNQISFVRGKKAGAEDDLYTMPSQGFVLGGEERQMTNIRSRILGPPTWTTDSRSLVYASNQSGEARLWRIPGKGGIPEAMPSAGVPSWHPTIPRHGTGLAYQHILNASSIWCLDQATRNKKDPLMVVISTNGRNEGPQLSPNGKKLAFMSDRAGSMEIWVSDPDGSYPLKLTNLGGSGSPRWSPDSRIITFDAVRDGQSSVYVVDLDGSEPTELKGAMPGDKVPSWSSDGRWIYFASERSGEDQVWRIPVAGGEPTRVTKGGGFAATESKDGEILYYAKTRYGHPEIWQIPTVGGKETLLSPLVRPGTWANWTVTSNGIFFVDDMGNDLSNLEYFDFKTRQVQLLVSLNGNSFWLSASQDGETLWYGQAAHDQSSIMVQPDFQ